MVLVFELNLPTLTFNIVDEVEKQRSVMWIKGMWYFSKNLKTHKLMVVHMQKLLERVNPVFLNF